MNVGKPMDRHEIEKVFKSYLPTVRAYRLAMEKAHGIKNDAQALRSMVITGMPFGSGKSDPTADAAARLLKAADMVFAAANRYCESIRLYEELVAMVTDPQAVDIIRLRWEQDIEFDYIPAKIHVSRRTMFYHYRRAIEEISEKTKDCTKLH